MATTIVRTAWIDDDGTGTTGTIINNAVKTELYNQIDQALAGVGAGTSGDFTVTGALTVTGAVTASSTLTVTGAVTANSTLRVVGQTNLDGQVVCQANINAAAEIRGLSMVVTGSSVLIAALPGSAAPANVSWSAATWALSFVTSAARYKRDIRPLDADLARVLALQPRVFKSTIPADGDGEIPGFIAEEVATVFPEAVDYDEAGAPRSVRYDRIAAYCVVAIQELAARSSSHAR